MFQEREILQNEESVTSLVKGIDLLADMVTPTLGPKGSNVMFTDMYGIPRITNDGVSIAKQVLSNNETENMAIDAFKQQAMRTNMLAGDASTTFITLTRALIKEGLKSKKHSLAKREEINAHAKYALEDLEEMARPVQTFDEIKNIATISAESEEIGALIAEASEKVGKEGQINVQESETNGIRVEYTNGLEIEEGYIEEFMMNNDRGEAVLTNPHILVVNSRLENIKDILPILNKLAEQQIPEVLLVCDGLGGNMIPTIAANKRAKYVEGKNVIEIFAVKFPAVRKQEFVEDIALFTKANVMGMSTGLFPDKAEISDLGRCEKVIITGKKTVFINGAGDVSETIEGIKNQRNSSEINKDVYDARIARLKGQVAIIKVGAPAGVDLGYLKDKIEDAIYATKGAIQEGAVRGGGLALKQIAQGIPEGILNRALSAPYNQIQKNAGRKKTLFWYTGGLEIAPNVFDSVKSTRIVVENACSFAGSFLTLVGSIATKRIKQ